MKKSINEKILADEITSVSKQHLRLWLGLLRTTRFIEARLRDSVRASGDITLPQFEVLAQLERHKLGLKMNELSALLVVSGGNVTGIVERLVQRGWVRRSAVAGDKRQTAIFMTDLGLASFEKINAKHSECVDELLSHFDANESARMVELLGMTRYSAIARKV